MWCKLQVQRGDVPPVRLAPAGAKLGPKNVILTGGLADRGRNREYQDKWRDKVFHPPKNTDAGGIGKSHSGDG